MVFCSMNFKYLFVVGILISGIACAATANEVKALNIGYAEIIDDARYDHKRAYARIRIKPHHRPVVGAEVAIKESKVLSRALKMKFGLSRIEAEDAKDMADQIRRLNLESGIQFFIIDADARVLTIIAESTADLKLMLFNISAYADELRGGNCQAHLMHVIPSYSMLTDALSQFLVYKKWREVLVLKGQQSSDVAIAEAFVRSAKRFGVKIEAEREFVPGNDPREREQNNITLMTADSDADLVFIADVEGEFGRYVEYQTRDPLPVIGTEGLQASSWHWAWERHGTPQLNQRFERHAKRRMQAEDWAAWAAVKSVIESISRTRSDEFDIVQQYLRSDKLNLDAYKGAPLSYRTWDNQLRQPLLLHTYNAVIERVPIKGFLHPTENMDTLGYDQGEKRCQLKDFKT